MGHGKLSSGALNLAELREAIQDSEGPSQKLNTEVVDTIFGKTKNNLEFYGIDFKLFYLLMQGIDMIYIYGKTENGYMNDEEWVKMMGDSVVRADFLDNIDDIYIDMIESEEHQIVTDHWTRQAKILSKNKKRRFMRVSKLMKKLPDNEEARKMIAHIYDIN